MSELLLKDFIWTAGAAVSNFATLSLSKLISSPLDTHPEYNPHVPPSVMVWGVLVPYDPTNWRNYVEVSIRDSNGNYCANEIIPAGANPNHSAYCTKDDATKEYSLDPGYSFSIQFIATEPREDGEIFRSAPVIKQITVSPLPGNITP